MRIYLAGYYNGKASAYSLTPEMYTWFLESYHYINTARHVAMIRADKRTIFLDSGAFSAFTKGAEIRIKDYAGFITKNKDIIHLACNLDNLHRQADKTYANQKTLEGMGHKVLPVFHCREDPVWLKKYIDEGYEYIALGGMVPESKQWLQKWLDDLWGNYLTDSSGKSRIKVHGFGLTTIDLILRYPWFSVDSTRWVLLGRYGQILYINDQGIPITVHISDQSPRRKDWDTHYDTMTPEHKKKLTYEIERRGFNPDELRSIYWKRDLFNVATFKELNDMERSVTFKLQQQHLF